MTGKLADTVMSVRNGEQIARKYQPVVYNPSTPAQVATRAKLKLMSQLSAVMAPVIAIPREGNVSARNLFVKKNYGATSYADNSASVNLEAVKITDSVVPLPPLSAVRHENQVTLSLTRADADINRVVYCLFYKEDDELRFRTSIVVNTPGTTSHYETTIQASGLDEVVYAYGIRDNSDAARTKFGNMEVPTAQSIAQLIVSRAMTNTDITITETRYVSVPVSA